MPAIGKGLAVIKTSERGAPLCRKMPKRAPSIDMLLIAVGHDHADRAVMTLAVGAVCCTSG